MPLSNEDYQSILSVLEKHQSSTNCFSFFCKKKTNLNAAHMGLMNFSQNLNYNTSLVININDINTLQAIHAEISRLNKTKALEDIISMRVAAGGKRDSFNNELEYSQSYSLTPCVEASVILRLVGEDFQKITVKNKSQNIMTVGAGVQLWDLQNTLYDKHGLVLETASLIPFLTFVGLALNGGHGTGKNAPAVTGLIKSMTLLTPDGAIKTIKEGDADFEAIRGSNLGLFGIVLEVDVQCAPAKKLHCLRDACNMHELKRQLNDGLFFKNDIVSLMWVPHYQGDIDSPSASNNIVILKFTPVDNTAPDINYPPTGLRSHLGQELMMSLSELGGAFNIATLLSRNPELIPTYMRAVVAKLEIREDNETQGPWPHIWHYMTAFPKDIADDDYLFTIKEGDSEPIVRAIEKVDSFLKAYANRGLYPVVDAIYLRVLKGTNGGISTTYHEPDEYVCGFDIVSNKLIPGYAAFRKDLEEFFISEFNARPHWGKSLPDNLNYARTYGERYPQFIEVLKRWYASCNLPLERSPHLNSFTNMILKSGLALNEEKAAAHVAETKAHEELVHVSPASSGEIAEKVLTKIQHEEGEAINTLKDELMRVIVNDKVEEMEDKLVLNESQPLLRSLR